MAVRGPVQGGVMYSHYARIACQVQVGLDKSSAHFYGAPKGRHSVFRGVPRSASMCHNPHGYLFLQKTGFASNTNCLGLAILAELVRASIAFQNPGFFLPVSRI